MTTKLSVTIKGRLAANETAERAELVIMLNHIAQQIGTGNSLSGDVRDRNGAAVVGDWNYTPTAAR